MIKAGSTTKFSIIVGTIYEYGILNLVQLVVCTEFSTHNYRSLRLLNLVVMLNYQVS